MKNKWIVYFDKYMLHRYGAIESDDLKAWQDVSDRLAMPAGIRHGSVFSITKEEFEKLSKMQ